MLTLINDQVQVICTQPRKSDEISTVVGVHGYRLPYNRRGVPVVKRIMRMQGHETNSLIVPADGKGCIIAPIPFFILFCQEVAHYLDFFLNKHRPMMDGCFDFLLEHGSKRNMLCRENQQQ